MYDNLEQRYKMHVGGDQKMGTHSKGTYQIPLRFYMYQQGIPANNAICKHINLITNEQFYSKSFGI